MSANTVSANTVSAHEQAVTAAAAPTVHAPTKARHLSRRTFLQMAGGSALAVAAGAGYVRVVEPEWVAVDEITLTLPGLPSALDGKRVAQLSDIHISKYLGPEKLLDAVERINALAPDWLFLTGDYSTGGQHYTDGLVDPLGKLEMPTFAIYGNHDHWGSLDTVRQRLEEAGMTVLQNGSRQLAAGLWVAGVDDAWSGTPDLKATLADPPADAVTLLLAHEPDYFDVVLRAQAPIAAQFSGHSHGGQVRLPTLTAGPDGRHTFAPILPHLGQKYPIGLRQIDGRWLYTNRGLGMWPKPYRLNCRPEITLFTLRPA